MIKVTLILCFVAGLPGSLNAGIMRYVKDEQWDLLKLAQFWPGSSCIYMKEKGCVIPKGTTGWTIHGLWPSVFSGKSPEGCNKSMPFNYTEIKPLRHQLDVEWPNFNKSGDRLHLWKHEWEVHGTCAYSLSVLRGEMRFFNTTLHLHSKVDLYSALNTRGITPSKDKIYNLSEIFLEVVDAYNKYPIIVCYCLDDKYYLAQIYLCYDKTLTLIDCPPESTNNSKDSKKTCSKDSTSALYFESMRSKPVDQPTKTPKGYFVDCNNSESVYYPPFPASQAIRATNV